MTMFPESMHSTLKWTRQLSGSGAAGIADLAGYKRDLDNVDAACRRIITLSTVAPPDDELIEMIWTSAIVNYARFHSRGARQPLSPDLLDALSAASKATHDRLLATRDKHVAHSVNSMETNLAMYELSDPTTGTREVLRVGVLSMLAGSDRASEARFLLALSAEVRALLERLTSQFHAHVLEQLVAMDIDELYAEKSILETKIAGGALLTETRKGPHNRGPAATVKLV